MYVYRPYMLCDPKRSTSSNNSNRRMRTSLRIFHHITFEQWVLNTLLAVSSYCFHSPCLCFKCVGYRHRNKNTKKQILLKVVIIPTKINEKTKFMRHQSKSLPLLFRDCPRLCRFGSIDGLPIKIMSN